jgi:hypothetical protein
VIAISLAPLVQSLAENQMQFQLNVVGLKMRNGLMAAIYRKCLRLRYVVSLVAAAAAAADWALLMQQQQKGNSIC